MNTFNLFIDQLKELELMFNPDDFFNPGDEGCSFEELTEILELNDAFEGDIIYYNKAIAFLAESDPSLEESIEIANELGYSISDLNSELLASLLLGKRIAENWHSYKTDIEDILDNVQELEDGNEDEEL